MHPDFAWPVKGRSFSRVARRVLPAGVELADWIEARLGDELECVRGAGGERDAAPAPAWAQRWQTTLRLRPAGEAELEESIGDALSREVSISFRSGFSRSLGSTPAGAPPPEPEEGKELPERFRKAAESREKLVDITDGRTVAREVLQSPEALLKATSDAIGGAHFAVEADRARVQAMMADLEWTMKTAVEDGLKDHAESGLTIDPKAIKAAEKALETPQERWEKEVWPFVPDDWDVLRLAWFGARSCAVRANAHLDLAVWFDPAPDGPCRYCGAQAYLVLSQMI